MFRIITDNKITKRLTLTECYLYISKILNQYSIIHIENMKGEVIHIIKQ